MIGGASGFAEIRFEPVNLQGEGGRLRFVGTVHMNVVSGKPFDEIQARSVFERVLAQMKKAEEIGLKSNVGEFFELARESSCWRRIEKKQNPSSEDES